MDSGNKTYEHAIIGGTIKAATSSVFAYLSAHPEVCGSSVKEPAFFSHGRKRNSDGDIESYKKYFAPQPGARIMVEATPNYLAYKENIAPRIKALLPDVKLIFILRDPVDRLYSFYNFAVGQLQLPESLAFEDYVDLCEQYSSSNLTPGDAGIAEKHLRGLELGKYSKYLKNYYDVFDSEQVKILFYDDLKQDSERFMEDACCFIGVYPEFYRKYTFHKANVTFSARVKSVHYIAMLMNRLFESLLRRRPGMKKSLVRIYKRMNQDREGYVPMKESTRTSLRKYYSPYNKELLELLSGLTLPGWVK